MGSICLPSLRGLFLALALLLLPAHGAAQLAPTGPHYAGRPSDTGYEPGKVNASGGYAVSVPLDLPDARGGLPVPLHITYGARGVGAAGLAWDVPLSYVRRNKTFAHRRPADGVDVGPIGRDQVTLFLDGHQVDFVHRGQEWVARRDAPELRLREQDAMWVLLDGQGRSYVFIEPLGLAGAGISLLKWISGSGGSSTVQLDYEIASQSFSGGTGVAIDLVGLRYNMHPAEGCAKHQIVLEYGTNATTPLALTMLDDRVIVRMRTLSAVNVNSRATCADAVERIRRYELTYQADADTRQPRLHSVVLRGRQGSAEENATLPVATYEYGTASQSGRLLYLKTSDVALPASVDTSEIASTRSDSVPTPGGFSAYSTWQSFIDVTGDGRPDLVYRGNNALWAGRNRPGPGGSTTIGQNLAIGPLTDATFTGGPLELRAATHPRFSHDANFANIDEVWRQAIDVNGDGRVDIIDATEQENAWVVYFNTPGPGNSGVTWVKRSFSTAGVRKHLTARGFVFSLDNDFIPLSRRFTGRDQTYGVCWRFTTGGWQEYPAGFGTYPCTQPQGLVETGGEKTYTEWELADVNGDGYPDLVMNSSPVDFVLSGKPDLANPDNGQLAYTHLTQAVEPRQAGANNVDVMFNVVGIRVDLLSNPFGAPVTLRLHSACGVELWRRAASMDLDDAQELECGILDVNGDGLLDRIESTTARLGTGSHFSNTLVTLPGRVARQINGHRFTCDVPHPPPAGDTRYYASQTKGLRDLTGDGIPDYVYLDSDSNTWYASIGTGTGFAPAIPIEVPGSSFAFSSQVERCDGALSSTRGGLYDIDGDGKPEVVSVGNNGNLEVYQLAGGSVPRTPEAGRLVQVDNGYGAQTKIGYRSAKEDGATPHQVPFPEIVVTSVETVGTKGLGGTLAIVRYAYGGAEMVFDPAVDAYTLPAYARSIEVRLAEGGGNRGPGTATITDTYPLESFSAAMSKQQRFGRYAKIGRASDMHVLSGILAPDPWLLLADAVNNDPRRTGSVHYDWDVRLSEEPTPLGENVWDCIDMMHPFDFAASFGDNLGVGYDVCTAHGFVYGVAMETWRGQEAPPSTRNVATRQATLDVDDFGRPLLVRLENDRYRSDDDVCIESTYAVPTGIEEWVLDAPTSRRIGECFKSVTYAEERWEYDGLPPGNVSAGRPTAHIVDRYSTDAGQLLGTLREYDATYDTSGNPTLIGSARADGAVRQLAIDYDPFALAPVRVTLDASGVPTIAASYGIDALTLDMVLAKDPNGTQRGRDFDGFGRIVRQTAAPAGAPLGVTAFTTYLGFSGTDPFGRRVVSKSFPDPVALADAANATGQTETVYLDELGRERRAELGLGPDYGNETLVTLSRTYDGLGRVAFQADPFPLSQDAQSAYGTAYYFSADGSPSCTIRGAGPQALTQVTDEVAARYPTCYDHTFENHQETFGVRDAASLLSGSSQAGVVNSVTTSAIGRALSRSTWKGATRLEYATYAYDPLGQLTQIWRFQDPVGGTNGVLWASRFDSLGQRLRLDEPTSATRNYTYSDWGELTEIQWTDTTGSPPVDRRLARDYDALGRVTKSVERRDGAEIPDTADRYFYDVGVSVTPQMAPTNVLGRLAYAQAPSGDVYLSYDASGLANARVFDDHQGSVYVEKTGYRFDGKPSSLQFFLPDTASLEERVDYAYDSASRLRSVIYTDQAGSRPLLKAESIDPFGRIRKANYGGAVTYTASYADVGRRLPREITVASANGVRKLVYLAFDAAGREKSRIESKDSNGSAVKTSVAYDALGRLASAIQIDGTTTIFNDTFTYDALGNILTLADAVGTGDATLSYRINDRDRICRIGYGNGGLGGTTCNVVHDGVGNIIRQPTRTGVRELDYFAGGQVRKIDQGNAQATFRYDAFGALQALDVEGPGVSDPRHDRRYGGLIERHDQLVGGGTKSIISRQIPALGGIIASRRGAAGPWIFAYGEERGSRFFTDEAGNFVQDVRYQPYGEATSSGSLPGSAEYTNGQFNGGDALAGLGLVNLGARVYDPVIGRFLSRDPLLVSRTASTTNPYGFALDDPQNVFDPRGLDPDCMGQECTGGSGAGGQGGDPWSDVPEYSPFRSHPSSPNPVRNPFRAPPPVQFSLNAPSDRPFGTPRHWADVHDLATGAQRLTPKEYELYIGYIVNASLNALSAGQTPNFEEIQTIAFGNVNKFRWDQRFDGVSPFEAAFARVMEQGAIDFANSRRSVRFGLEYDLAAAANVTPPLVTAGAYEFWAHGSPNSLGMRAPTVTLNGWRPVLGQTWTSFAPADVAAALRPLGWTPGQPIVLGACNAGAIPNGIAQSVADFTHSVVYAPKGYGVTSYGGPLNSPLGWATFTPR